LIVVVSFNCIDNQP